MELEFGHSMNEPSTWNPAVPKSLNPSSASLDTLNKNRFGDLGCCSNPAYSGSPNQVVISTCQFVIFLEQCKHFLSNEDCASLQDV